jgi:triosephosphate isomerase
MRDQIVAGNWKMNKDHQQALSLTTEVQRMMVEETPAHVEVVIAAPFIYLSDLAKMAISTRHLHISAQNCHQEMSGAYTGEISASMLKSIGVEYVILGHSERREYFEESNELLAKKVNAVLEEGLRPVFCCGEPLEVRELNQQESFVNSQLTESLFHLKPDDFQQVVIAYEPIWAIGTGRTASAEQAQQMHQSIRIHLASHYGDEVAIKIPILYGGSCKPSNAQEIFSGADVDGGLIGGASLKAEDFMAIVRSL